VDVIAVHHVLAPLLHAEIIIAVVERGKMRLTCKTKLEAHLRVTHEVAVLFAVVRDSRAGSPIGPDWSNAKSISALRHLRQFWIGHRICATRFEITGEHGLPCSRALLWQAICARLASVTGCAYTRYADDLTFSTNLPTIPSELAVINGDQSHEWLAGNALSHVVAKSGYTINTSKTRLQYRNSRQDVTGLVVNKKVAGKPAL
jgi:hypothetical protein